MKILSLLLAALMAFSGCAYLGPIGDWAKTPAGQEVINAALMDALKLLPVLLLAAGPQESTIEDRLIEKLMAMHPELTRAQAKQVADKAIQMKLHAR